MSRDEPLEYPWNDQTKHDYYLAAGLLKEFGLARAKQEASVLLAAKKKEVEKYEALYDEDGIPEEDSDAYNKAVADMVKWRSAIESNLDVFSKQNIDEFYFYESDDRFRMNDVDLEQMVNMFHEKYHRCKEQLEGTVLLDKLTYYVTIGLIEVEKERALQECIQCHFIAFSDARHENDDSGGIRFEHMGEIYPKSEARYLENAWLHVKEGGLVWHFYKDELALEVFES